MRNYVKNLLSLGYKWDFTFKSNGQKTTKKTYSYDYYNINKSYYSAVTTCKKLGHGWDVASFNFTLNFVSGKVISDDETYDRSVKSIRLVKFNVKLF